MCGCCFLSYLNTRLVTATLSRITRQINKARTDAGFVVSGSQTSARPRLMDVNHALPIIVRSKSCAIGKTTRKRSMQPEKPIQPGEIEPLSVNLEYQADPLSVLHTLQQPEGEHLLLRSEERRVGKEC